MRRRRNPSTGINIALGVAAVAFTGGALWAARESMKKLINSEGGINQNMMQNAKQFQLAAGGMLLGGMASAAALGSTWGPWGAAAGPVALVALGTGAGMMVPAPKPPADTPALEGSGIGLPLFP